MLLSVMVCPVPHRNGHSLSPLRRHTLQASLSLDPLPVEPRAYRSMAVTLLPSSPSREASCCVGYSLSMPCGAHAAVRACVCSPLEAASQRSFGREDGHHRDGLHRPDASSRGLDAEATPAT